MENRKYIAIDLKSFYASVECVERGLDPLTTKLVVADESRTDKTICLAVSPAMKAFGIPGRARLFEVRAKAKEIEKKTGQELDYIIAPPRMAKYVQVSSEIYATYLDFVSPEDIHVYSIDECFIDVTNYLNLYKLSAHDLAVNMIHAVLKKTGITATAGIGTNLYLSKIAMDIVAKHIPADKDGVRIAELDEATYRRDLWSHRPITDFWRVGPGISKRLAQRGMFTMGDIAKCSVEDENILYNMLGIDAEILIDHAWGYEPCTIKDIKDYKPNVNCLSSGQVLTCPYDNKKARIVVQEMTDLLVLDMVEKELATSSLTLTIGYDRCTVDEGSYAGEVTFDHYGRAVPKPAHGTANLGCETNSTKKIMDAVLALYDEMTDPAIMIRRISLTANNLVEEGYEQLDLFSNVDDQGREKKMQKTMLSIKKKYGKNAILKGMNLEEGATTIERNKQIGGHKA